MSKNRTMAAKMDRAKRLAIKARLDSDYAQMASGFDLAPSVSFQMNHRPYGVSKRRW